MRVLCKFSLAVALCGLQWVQCSLILGQVKCGQRTCQQWEYCSKVDKTCQPCKSACDSTSHNFEKEICEESCQGGLCNSKMEVSRWLNVGCVASFLACPSISIYAVLVRPGYSNQSFENSALRKGPLTDSYIDREREKFFHHFTLLNA